MEAGKDPPPDFITDFTNSTNSTNLTLFWSEEPIEAKGFFSIPHPIIALMYIMYIAITLAAVGGNSIVCYIVIAYQRMRTVTNFFIVNLAVGDITMAILCIPFTFVANFVTMYWPFGSIMCPIVTYAQAVSVFISAYTLVAISIDRYIAILYPLRPRMTKLQAKVIILLIWVVSLVTPLPTAILSRLIPLPNMTVYTCAEDWESPIQRYYYSMTLMVLQYFFPLFVLIFTYTKIAVVVWGKTAPGEAEDGRDQRLAASKRKMIKMMIACVTAFTLSWLPFNVLHVVGDQHPGIYTYAHIIYIWFICHWLAMSHACLNPLIYWWMNSKFRAGFHYVCRCLPWMNPIPDHSELLSRTTIHQRLTTNTTALIAAAPIKPMHDT
uniref:G-protein coupled receptors family 1 profile domain-containing protein n=1 Tax=Strigamia maritima TaxID=126957 RepID=T1J5B1_STRMM